MKERTQGHGRTVNDSEFNIEEARKRRESATEGPWYVDLDGPTAYVWFKGGDDIKHMTRADAEFVSHARSDLPATLEMLEKARRQLKAIKVYGDRFVDWHQLCASNGVCGQDEPGGPPCRSPRYGSLIILGEGE